MSALTGQYVVISGLPVPRGAVLIVRPDRAKSSVGNLVENQLGKEMVLGS
jgi:hypothetical protein